MKRILSRIALGLVGLLLLLILIGVVFVYGLNPKVKPVAALTAPTDAASVARGEYLADSVLWCVRCHSDIQSSQPLQSFDKTKLFAGHDFGNAIGGGGTRVVAPNLTSSKDHGIGAWSDGEVVRAIRDGVSKDGRPLFGMMPYEHFGQTLTDADALAVVAYLRTVPPSANSLPKSQFGFPFSVLVRLMPKPSTPPATIPAAGTPEYDTWILNAALCSFCHATYDEQHNILPGHEFGGGQETEAGDGVKLRTPNISSDPVTGIGSYSEDDIVHVLEGTSKSGAKIRAMPTGSFSTLTVEDKHAIARAVKRLPPVTHAVAR